MQVRIIKVIENWNMQYRHKLRRRYLHLRTGEVVLVLNRRRTIARLVDASGGLHDYYADKNQQFDLAGVQQMMKRGLRVDLTIGASERNHARHMEIAA